MIPSITLISSLSIENIFVMKDIARKTDGLKGKGQGKYGHLLYTFLIEW